MSDLDAIGQKIKGKAQQITGKINQASGNNVKGGWQKLKGKANETIADAKLRARDESRKDDTNDL